VEINVVTRWCAGWAICCCALWGAQFARLLHQTTSMASGGGGCGCGCVLLALLALSQ